MPAHGRTDSNTLRIQDYVRRLESGNPELFSRIEELLSILGYMIYRNQADILMVRKPKDINSYSLRDINALLRKDDDHDQD